MQAKFFASGADLLRPVFAVAMVGAAVAHAVAFGDQQIDVQVHADTSRKSHFTDCCPQAAVALVVVGQKQTLLAQVVDSIHQIQ